MEAELYGHHETVAGEDPDVALRAEEDPLSQNSAGSDYSGPTQKMGQPRDAD